MMKKLLSVLLAGVLAAGLSGCAADGSEPIPNDPAIIDAADFLSVEGNTLVNKNGEPVILRGVNLGGWLLQECWMCPVTGADGEWGNLDTIRAMEANGLTPEQIQSVFDTYQDNWITEYDLDIIAESGANCIRVPFWYRNFMLDEVGTWITESIDDNPGIKRLDWVIEEAAERGMYVILDLHGCPGGQSMNHSCGTVGEKALYSTPEYRAAMKDLWVTLAERYKDEPAVAAYDLMNEPQNNDEAFSDHPNYLSAWDEASWEETNDLYREMVAAVRAVDPDHVISVEGIWRITNLPKAKKEGWTNMLYQVHLYDDDESFKKLAKDIARYGKKNDIAVYVGEFSNLNGIAFCEENDLNWTTWTYKGGRGNQGTWFWYYGSPAPVDPIHDDYETILQKWGEAIRTDTGNFSRSSVTYKKIAKGLSGE